MPTWKAKSLSRRHFYAEVIFCVTWKGKFKTIKIKLDKNPYTQANTCLLHISRNFKDIFKYISFKYIRWFSQNVSIIDVKQGSKYVSAFELARRSNWIFSCIAFTLCWFSASGIREKIQNRELHRIDQHSYQLLSYHRLISVNVSLLSILLLKIMFDVFLLFWKKIFCFKSSFRSWDTQILEM